MAGWGLVEALLASLLLSTGMVLLLKGQAALREYSDFARERAAAAVLAEAQVERLRAELASGVASGAGSDDAGLSEAISKSASSEVPPAVATTGFSTGFPSGALPAAKSTSWSASMSASSSASMAAHPFGDEARSAVRPPTSPPWDAVAFASAPTLRSPPAIPPKVLEALAKPPGAALHAVTGTGAAATGVPLRTAASPPIHAPHVRPDSGRDEAGATEASWHEDLDSSRYVFRQRRTGDGAGLLQDLDLQLKWQDRLGAWQTLRWPARLAVGDPVTALHALSPQTSGEVALTRARHASIPETARPLTAGWLAFQPEGGAAVAWLLDARSGWVLGLCELGGRSVDDLRAADVADCRSRMVGGGALLLSGEVRFDLGDRPSPSMPASTALPLGLVLRLSGPSPVPAPPHCISNAAIAVARGLAAVSYHCLVYPRSTDQRWSGRSELSGTAADLRLYRVCRYSADHDLDGRISNPEHPADYLDVDGPLTQQNFLVIRAGLSCPTGLPADPAAGRLLDMGTQPHQPVD